MPELGTYGSFAAVHEERLVRSLVSESGLPPEAAARVVADVLPVAYERRFATSGAAYGWLRVAARHHAAGDPAWSDAADTAICHADSARTLLACLSPADRELLRLRYAEGLRPETLAERLGLPLADVLARLDRAGSAAARALSLAETASRSAASARPAAPASAEAAEADEARRPFGVPVVRLAAAAAAVAAAVLVVGTAPAPTVPPAARGALPAFAGPGSRDADIVPVAASERPGRGVAIRPASTDTVVAPAGTKVPGRDSRPPTGPCRSNCTGDKLVDEIHIPLPKDARSTVGREEVVVPQEVGGEHVRACDALEPLPREHAYCVRGRG